MCHSQGHQRCLQQALWLTSQSLGLDGTSLRVYKVAFCRLDSVRTWKLLISASMRLGDRLFGRGIACHAEMYRLCYVSSSMLCQKRRSISQILAPCERRLAEVWPGKIENRINSEKYHCKIWVDCVTFGYIYEGHVLAVQCHRPIRHEFIAFVKMW